GSSPVSRRRWTSRRSSSRRGPSAASLSAGFGGTTNLLLRHWSAEQHKPALTAWVACQHDPWPVGAERRSRKGGGDEVGAADRGRAAGGGRGRPRRHRAAGHGRHAG